MYINKRNKIKLVDFIVNLIELLSNGRLCRNVNKKLSMSKQTALKNDILKASYN